MNYGYLSQLPASYDRDMTTPPDWYDDYVYDEQDNEEEEDE